MVSFQTGADFNTCPRLNRGRLKNFCSSAFNISIYQYKTQSAFPAFKNKQIISPLLLYAQSGIWGERSLSHGSPPCPAGGVGTGEMPSQLPHPCAWSEFCSKVHQIYFIPFCTPLGSSCNPAFWFCPLWNRDIVIFLNVTYNRNDKTSRGNNDISSSTVSPGTMLEH